MIKNSRAFKIVLIYEIAGIIWMAISDAIFIRLYGAKVYPIVYMGTGSGMFFLLITGFILFKLINIHYYRLQNSEMQYRSYFEDNPTPMWIYSRKTLKFTSVNEAAIANYGYTREEFLHMTILDIRSPDEAEKVLDAVESFESNHKNSGIWLHKRKDGTDVYAQITSNLILSTNEQYVMVMANDATKRLQTEIKLQQANRELIKQNNILREISWSESHNVRRPLASILGLLNVMKVVTTDKERELCINYIEISACELDIMIHEINAQINGAVSADHVFERLNPTNAGLN